MSVIAVSDTHGALEFLRPLADHPADLLIHAGDFTYYGQERDFIRFWECLESLPFRHKVVVSGNHEISLDNGCVAPQLKDSYLAEFPCRLSREAIRHELSKRCVYLEHQSAEIEGVRLFGSPYTPHFCGSAFQYQPAHDALLWREVPADLDILVTHCPPFGILDRNCKQVPSGSFELRQAVRQRPPKFHVFGHIHEGKGSMRVGPTVFMNVAETPTRFELPRAA